MRPLYSAKTITIKLDNCKHFAETALFNNIMPKYGTIICTTHNLTCSEGLLKVSSISGLTGPKTATPLPDRRCNDFMIQFYPFPKKFALQFIDVCEPSSVHFLLQNTPNTTQLDLGRVSSVALNQACVEQIIVPYLGIILSKCFRRMFKIVQFYCYSFRTVKWSHS